MHSLKNTKDYWRQFFNNISILGILDIEIKICAKWDFYHCKGQKIYLYTFSRSLWEAGQIHYLCHLSLFKVVNTFTDINYFLRAVLLSF